MTTMNREEQKQVLIDTANHVINRDNTSPYSENLKELARIALASLEAKPIGAFHIAEQQVDGTSDYIKDGEWPIDNGTIEVYAAPPAPDVPAVLERLRSIVADPRALPRRKEWVSGQQYSYVLLENVEAMVDEACRAAMRKAGNSPVTPDGWISCSEQMPVIGELNWRTSFPLLVTCEIGVIPAYYGFVSVNGDRHYGFMESLKYGDDNGNHPQTNEYGLISNVTHWMPLPEPPQEVNRG
ncbi:DUF551 domain-containing protein [Escherichia coli]|nr:DUF551 domain-containing protein [Escherichia coli]ELH8647611.1 DUF551 domain-containing protein [Escherichia coli]